MSSNTTGDNYVDQRHKNAKKYNIISGVIVAVLSLFRIWVQSLLPIYPIVEAGYDDFLMIKYADLLGSDGGWLGAYNSYTLNKPAGYALLLRFNHMIHGHYELIYGIIISLACVLLFISSRKLFKSNIKALLLFVAALFCPILIECNVAGRIYNMSLVPVCILVLIASYMGIIAERNNGFLKMLPWIICASLDYAYYRFLRVDYIWIELFLIGITAYIIILYIIEHRDKENKKESIKKFILQIVYYIIPFAAGILMTNAICLLNYIDYGIYATTDFNETHFASMCSLLMSVESDKNIPGVYVTKDSLYKASEVSPGLKALLEEREKSGWNFTREDGEMDIEFYAWNLRFAADNIGYYEDAAETDKFYEGICDDLENAFANGTLKKRDVLTISPFSAPITVGDIPEMLAYSIKKGFGSVLAWSNINAAYKISTLPSDNPDSLLFEEISGEEILSEDELDNGLSISGWFCPRKTGDKLEIILFDEKGNEYSPELTDSADVYEILQIEEAKKCRIKSNITKKSGLDLGGNIFIRLTLNGETVYESSVEEIQGAGEIEGIHYGVETVLKHNRKKEVVELKKKYDKTLMVFFNLLKALRASAPFTAIFVAIIMLVEIALYVIGRIKKQETEFLPIMLKIGIILTMWINILIQSEKYFMVNSTFSPFYAAGSYMLYSILIGLCLSTAAGRLIMLRSKDKHGKKA